MRSGDVGRENIHPICSIIVVGRVLRKGAFFGGWQICSVRLRDFDSCIDYRYLLPRVIKIDKNGGLSCVFESVLSVYFF